MLVCLSSEILIWRFSSLNIVIFCNLHIREYYLGGSSICRPKRLVAVVAPAVTWATDFLLDASHRVYTLCLRVRSCGTYFLFYHYIVSCSSFIVYITVIGSQFRAKSTQLSGHRRSHDLVHVRRSVGCAAAYVLYSALGL